MNLETVLVYVVIVLVVILVAVVVNGIEEYNKKEKTKMSFMESLDLTGLPIVTFRNNKTKLNFLLDTGATLSIIDSNILDKLEYMETKEKTSVSGIEGNTKETNCIAMVISYKGKEYCDLFQLMDMQYSFAALQKDYGVTLHGILSSSFFDKYKYVLDFKDLIAYRK